MTCGRGCCATFREHLQGVSFSYKNLARGEPVTQIDHTEENWTRDGDAYMAMRRQGYQPPHIDGSAELAAKATSPIEIEHGAIYGAAGSRMAQDTQDEIRGGWTSSSF